MPRTLLARLTVAALSLFLAACSDDTATIEVRVVSDLVPYFEVGSATVVLHRGAASALEAELASSERSIAEGEPLARGLYLEVAPVSWTGWD
jgi:hypothetical protein